MENKKETVLFNREDIQKRVEELGKEITEFYSGEEVIVIPILRGGFVFAADLIREIKVPVVVDFAITSSYESREYSSGDVKILSDLREDIKGKNVLIVDDIMDSGHTLNTLKNLFGKRDPKSLNVCVLLDKPSRRQVDIKPEFRGFEIDDLFIVGYGLNYGKHYRNIPYIFSWED
ncbi:hypoxanthine phosphoribosyltransferase [Lagierella sp.]|uniref:hypoxanthine phosphoribosyltransferase n=1 Tax=Lagierella sp. TaxID=2849657 RepID=UPI002624E1FE|nr:hypoxanthine phosphoribosyltransferase [Lagierella sp.]